MRIGNKVIAIAAYAALMAGSALTCDRAIAAPITLYDDLAGASAGVDQIGVFGPDYNSFSTGSSAFRLNGLSLLVKGGAADTGSFNLSLYADNAGSAGATAFDLGNYSDSLLNASLTNFAASFAPITLAANTRYWVGLRTLDSSVEWSYTFDNGGVGVANEFYQTPKGIYSNSGVAGGGAPYQMSVSGTPVTATPLPPALLLFATALGGLGLLASRRKKVTPAG